MSFWQENYAFIKVIIIKNKMRDFTSSLTQDVYDNRSEKMVEVMDKCDKGITEVEMNYFLDNFSKMI